MGPLSRARWPARRVPRGVPILAPVQARVLRATRKSRADSFGRRRRVAQTNVTACAGPCTVGRGSRTLEVREAVRAGGGVRCSAGARSSSGPGPRRSRSRGPASRRLAVLAEARESDGHARRPEPLDSPALRLDRGVADVDSRSARATSELTAPQVAGNLGRPVLATRPSPLRRGSADGADYC